GGRPRLAAQPRAAQVDPPRRVDRAANPRLLREEAHRPGRHPGEEFAAAGAGHGGAARLAAALPGGPLRLAGPLHRRAGPRRGIAPADSRDDRSRGVVVRVGHMMTATGCDRPRQWEGTDMNQGVATYLRPTHRGAASRALGVV